MNVSGALNFIVIYLFDIYIMIVFTRFLLQMVRADFYNPVSQFVVKATNPLIIPLRKIIPGFAGFDWAAIVLLVLMQCLAISLSLIITFIYLKFIRRMVLNMRLLN